MATTNRERVDQALMLLRDALVPYFRQLVVGRFGESAWTQALRAADRFDSGENVDLTRLFAIFHEYRHDLFREALGRSGVGFVHEAHEFRNRYAHQENFSTPDTLRALDTIQRILEIVQAPAAYDEVHKSHEQLLRSLYSEQARSETRRVTQNLKSQSDASLVPWRDVAMPHEDVRTGHLKEAEFAADLDQVHQGKAGPEYQNPVEFFGRTYLTEGLTALLGTALERLHGVGGDPVIELQTNFGGGKTHSMIALYHLADGFNPSALPPLEPVIQRLGTRDPLFAQRAVLVGTKLSPNQPRRKPDGTVVNTLWGELAWQLAGAQGYALVAESDRTGLAPGAQVLQELFEITGPSLILIDEWVAFVRMLYYTGGTPPIAGSFDANLTFAQTLTEAVTNTPQVLLAASLPSSDMEAGGEGGKEALRILKHTFSRVKSSWRPASSTEGFEIVRRRLFQDVSDFRKRDGTIRLFVEMYRSGGTLYPSAVQQAEYARRMESAYPFHPETFDKLFETWGSLETFQRTRGVLRLMANVVHTLWERKDASPLIMPANIPLDAVGVATEMGSYLPDSWTSVIEHDIDGDHALSLALDRENGNFDKLSATRRVARTIFLGSAPTVGADNRGIADQSIRLGVVQPGESASIFGDALRMFSEKATYLYSEHGNYWFTTQPSVTQLAQQRIDQLPLEDVDHELVATIRPHQTRRGSFDRVVVVPTTSGDVADTTDVTLVILGPEAPYARGQAMNSRAIAAATAMLDTRGDARRVYRNTLLFLAPDGGKLTALRDAMRQRIVWEEIERTHEALNLDPHQLRQAKSRAEEARKRVDAQIRDAWTWLLAPYSDPAPGSPVNWDARPIKSIPESESLPAAAWKRAAAESDVIDRFAGSNVRRAIESIPAFANGWTSIPAKDLATWFASYLYLPRLKNPRVLQEAIQDGLRSINWQLDAFAWADRFDAEQDRFVGLAHGVEREVPVSLNGTGLLVHPAAAKRQFDADEAARRAEEDRRNTIAATSAGAVDVVAPAGHDIRNDSGAWSIDERAEADALPVVIPDADPRHYFGAVTLNPQTLSSQVKEISQEVIANLLAIYGAKVRLSLEIQVEVEDGIPVERRRAVEENARALRFDQSDFVD